MDRGKPRIIAEQGVLPLTCGESFPTLGGVKRYPGYYWFAGSGAASVASGSGESP